MLKHVSVSMGMLNLQEKNFYKRDGITLEHGLDHARSEV